MALYHYILVQFYLKALGDKVNPLYQSAAVPFTRPVSEGTQTFSSDSSLYPINQPVPKLTSTLQVRTNLLY